MPSLFPAVSSGHGHGHGRCVCLLYLYGCVRVLLQP